jgi:FMN phosphatase YigB (HAD superfamily)
MAKPDPEIFLKTAEALNAAPVNILFLDDREDNVTVAAALDFQTILYKYADHAAFESEMSRRGFGSLLDVGQQSSNAQSPAGQAQQPAPATK